MEDRGTDARGADLDRVVLGLVLLGVGLRLARFLLNYPLWCDETMLAANLLDRGWADLARPLHYRQVAPIGFLALEWAAIRVLGFSEPSLRLVPLLAGVASVPLFAVLARQILGRGRAAVLAVALFAVAQPPIRYAAEMKPYATDLLVALGLLVLACRWRAAPDRPGRLWALAAVAPLAIALSLPSLFLLAVIGLLLGVELGRRRSPTMTMLPAALGLAAATAAAVAAMAWLGQYRTSPDDRAYFLKFWADAFPPAFAEPLALARWLAKAHTGALFAYPHGELRSLAWLNVLILASFLMGCLAWSRRDRRTLALLILPFLVTLAAAAFRRYPYGMSPRVAQFLVPSTLILAAAGVDRIMQRLRDGERRRRVAIALTGALLLFGGWRLAADLGRPYRTPWDRTAREFARWFWEELGQDAELVCLQRDLGIPISDRPWAYDANDQYLCYQRIYSQRHREGRPPRWDAISASHPLRCVFLRRGPDEMPAGFRAWLEEHRDEFVLRDVRSYPATRGSTVEPRQTYVVCELVPADPAIAAGTADPRPRR